MTFTVFIVDLFMIVFYNFFLLFIKMSITLLTQHYFAVHKAKVNLLLRFDSTAIFLYG